MSERRWVSRVRGLARDQDGRVLVLASGRGASLPYVELEGHVDDELETARAALVELVAFPVAVLRPVVRRSDEEAKTLDVAFELEPLGPVPPAPPGAAWLGPGEVAGSTLSPQERELVERLLADRPPPSRPDWARRGWLVEASAWMESALAELGRRTAGPVEQRSTWCISSILRVPTAEGLVYLKATASSPLFVDEGTVTRGLAEMLPLHIPRALAVDGERRRFLLDDFGEVVGWNASRETKQEVLALYGELQRETAGRVGELLALGAFDRSLDWLSAEIETLVRTRSALTGLDDEESERLEALLPRIAEDCARLAAGPVPPTIVHGDLHLDNVARPDGRYVFFDWTDACVTHPFLDLIMPLFEEDGEARRALVDVYLAAWREHAAEAELLELWELAEPLVSLNQAVSYRSIVESIEPGTGQALEWALPFWLRKGLAAADG